MLHIERAEIADSGTQALNLGVFMSKQFGYCIGFSGSSEAPGERIYKSSQIGKVCDEV